MQWGCGTASERRLDGSREAADEDAREWCVRAIVGLTSIISGAELLLIYDSRL